MTSIRSYIKKLFGKQNFIAIVSGLPRSGTSMMMSALRAGGLPLVVDEIREADANNPRGYYEFERVKKMPNGDTVWLKDARGKGLKVISALLEYLPDDYFYRVIFMQRDLDEVLASQERMLERSGKDKQEQPDNDQIRESYRTHLQDIKAWIGDQDWIQTLYVSYNDILSTPEQTMEEVAHFLEDRVDPIAMAGVVDPMLYREKSE
jgi:hypothetical protein